MLNEKHKLPSNTEILSWDPDDMEAYWAQNQRYDERPFDTLSIMGGTFNQYDSEQSFAQQFSRLIKRL